MNYVRIGLAIVAVAIVGWACKMVYDHIYDAGYNDAVAVINKKNAEEKEVLKNKIAKLEQDAKDQAAKDESTINNLKKDLEDKLKAQPPVKVVDKQGDAVKCFKTVTIPVKPISKPAPAATTPTSTDDTTPIQTPTQPRETETVEVPTTDIYLDQTFARQWNELNQEARK